MIETAKANGHGGVALVQTVLDPELEGLDKLARLGAVIGIQDRSSCSAIPTAAISRGAAIVEKRMRADDLEPDLVSRVVRDCEETWASLADGNRWTIN